MIQLIINIFKSYISNKNTLQARLPLGQGVITRPLGTMMKNNYTKNNLNFTCFFYKIRSNGIFSFLFKAVGNEGTDRGCFVAHEEGRRPRNARECRHAPSRKR